MDLPYLIDGQEHVTEMLPCVQYIAKKYGPRDFLGRSLEDEAQIDMFLWQVDSIFRELIRLGCPMLPAEKIEAHKKKVWLMLKEKMPAIEKFDKANTWYMGYLTVCDFFIYELMGLLTIFFPCASGKCCKLSQIAANVANLERIAAYENSERAIKCRLPKESWEKQCGSSSSSGRAQHKPSQ